MVNKPLSVQSIEVQEREGIRHYIVPSFERTGLVIHAFSGRNGGFSKGKYSTLNLSILTEDNLDTVLKNRLKFASVLDINPECFISAHQIHGDNVYKVTIKDKGCGAYDPDTVIPAADALMTNEKGLALLAFFADCVPVFFLDPIREVIALAHAGWRGTVAKIAAKTVLEMERNYGTDLQQLLVGIGPSIGPCHYQVDDPVIQQVEKAFPRSSASLLNRGENKNEGHAFLNLWEANRRQLIDVGVHNDNISIAGLCTYCFQDYLFSHRAGMLGRQAAVIMLK